MSTSRFNTRDLRLLSSIHIYAGAQAESAAFPWWCCWAYAASVSGTTDPEEIWQIGRLWLQGWSKQWSTDHDKQPAPALLQQVIEHATYSIQAGK
jgi:hypothetical protein